LTLILTGPSICGKTTLVIGLLQCREQLCNIAIGNTVRCHSENNATHYLKNLSFIEEVPDIQNPENIPILLVLDDLIDTASSTNVS